MQDTAQLDMSQKPGAALLFRTFCYGSCVAFLCSSIEVTQYHESQVSDLPGHEMGAP